MGRKQAFRRPPKRPQHCTRYPLPARQATHVLLVVLEAFVALWGWCTLCGFGWQVRGLSTSSKSLVVAAMKMMFFVDIDTRRLLLLLSHAYTASQLTTPPPPSLQLNAHRLHVPCGRRRSSPPSSFSSRRQQSHHPHHQPPLHVVLVHHHSLAAATLRLPRRAGPLANDPSKGRLRRPHLVRLRAAAPADQPRHGRSDWHRAIWHQR